MAQNEDVEAGVEVSRRVVLLGCTGSIGTQTVRVVDAAADRFSICAIAAAGSDVAALAKQAAHLQVDAVAVAREQAREPLVAALAALIPDPARRPQVSAGPQAVAELARYDADIVLNAVAGDQGLRATVAALENGTTVALANKESLIAGGRLVTGMAKPGQLIPVDSEHSAMAQCLRSGGANEVRKLILTASGGPFRGRTREQLRDVTPAQALAHPTWNMGTLVTTNSATLVNKGLELIEAHLLFEVALERIQAVVHPQSIVHSMVEFYDGSTIAQASPPDMTLPIALALGWPQRVPEAATALDWSRASSWSFEPVDNEAFPAIELARHAGLAGGCAPAVYNAANEECVVAFHSLRLDFLGIVDTVEKVLGEHMNREPHGMVPTSVDEIEGVQLWARARVRELLGDR